MDCVRGDIPRIYRGKCIFDPSDKVRTENGATVDVSCDAEITLTFEAISIRATHKNYDYAYSGDTSLRAKQSILPFGGAFGKKSYNQIRAEITGKVSRWFQMPIDSFNFADLICVESLCYIRYGYSFKQLQKVWLNLNLDAEKMAIIRSTLSIMMHTSRHLEMSSHEFYTLCAHQLKVSFEGVASVCAQVLPAFA